MEMRALDDNTEPPWEAIAPQLDEGLNQLSAEDRDAIVLRFLKRQDLRAVGAALGISEDAAQKRVSRAVERLREFFAKRGLTVGASGLVVVISANVVQAAPVGLAVNISTAAALAGTTIAATATVTKTIAMTALQKTIIGATLAAAIGTGIYETHRASTLKNELQALQQQQATANSHLRQDTTAPSTTTRPATFDWRMVESADYKKYIANLRGIGCPEETIRDIIIAAVDKLFASRMQALKSTNRYEFWKSIPVRKVDPKEVEQRQLLAREKRVVLKELLGVEPEEKPDLWAALNLANPFEGALDFLSPEKQREVAELHEQWQAKRSTDFRSRIPDAEDMKQLGRQKKQLEAELAKILTPQELEDYRLRMSETAGAIRGEFRHFDLTEQEFRDIFTAKKKFDDEFNPMDRLMGWVEGPEQTKMEAAKVEMEAQIREALGDARYAEYKRSQDSAYEVLARLAEREGLPKEAVARVYDMKKTSDDAVKKVLENGTLSGEQRTAALQGIRTETENSIRAVLGDKGFKSYRKQPSAQQWLNNITYAQEIAQEFARQRQRSGSK